MFDINTALGLIIPIILTIALGLGLIWGLRHFKIPIPLIGSKIEYFTYTMIDEGRNEIFGKIPIKNLKPIGNKVYFKLPHGIYRVMRERITRRNGLPYSRYSVGKSIPLPIDNDINDEITAQEGKEMADSKVVFDLLRFTLSNVETLFLLVAIAAVVISGIDGYLIYNLGNQIGQMTTNLNTVIHYLYPNGIPTH